jgi:capsid assembly protein Gp20
MDNNYNFLINPFKGLFKSLVPPEQKKKDDEAIYNSVTTSEDDLYNLQRGQSRNGGYVNTQISFDQVFNNKAEKIKKYRDMADFPEINDALDICCDEAIVKDSDGVVASLNITEEDDFPSDVLDKIYEESEYLIKNVFKIQKRGWGLFRKFLTEGEVFLEKIPNKSRDGISSLKVMPAFRSVPIYESNIIRGFVHGTIDPEKQYTLADIKLLPNQVAYTCWDDYINGDITDPKSYLHAALRTYNQLRSLEDSLIVYRLSRALEKRVFNVEVGQMPPNKAREFINKLINQYKKNNTYNPETGVINQTQNLMSFNEDFWFDQHDGKGSSVTTLQSGMNLGKLEDIELFRKKMYITLKLPKSRWDESSSPFGNGKNGEISREEIKFDLFVERIQSRFSDLFTDVLITHLKMKGVDDEYLDPGKFHYSFTKANYFAVFKELELSETQAALMNNYMTLIYSPMNPNGIYSSEYVLKKILKMTDQEFDENKKLLEQAKKSDPPMDPFGGLGQDGNEDGSPGGSKGTDGKPQFSDFNKDLSKNKPPKKPVKPSKVEESARVKLEDGEIL